MLTRAQYRGLFAYPPTPFTRRLALDEDALRANIRKLVRIGADGIVLAGTSGEFYTLQTGEYRRIAQILRTETQSTRVSSVMGAFGMCTEDVVETARIAMEEGIDAVLAMQPHFIPLTSKELVRFWKTLGHVCPEIGLIINHYSGVRQTYTLEIFRDLAGIPNLVGSKEAHWDFSLWRQMHRRSPLPHMSSTDAGWLVELVRHKAIGVGSLQVCMMPHVVRQVLELCAKGRFAEAEGALMPFTELVARLKIGHGNPHVFPSVLKGWEEYGTIARHKALVDAFGFLQAGPPRPPSIAVSAPLQAALRDFLRVHYSALLPPAALADRATPLPPLWPLTNPSSRP